MLVSYLEHTPDEWKNVNILLQKENDFITYVTCVYADEPAHLHGQSNQDLHCL